MRFSFCLFSGRTKVGYVGSVHPWVTASYCDDWDFDRCTVGHL